MLLPQQVTSGLERGMVRGSRTNLLLRNLLSRDLAWLDRLFGDASVPVAYLNRGNLLVEFDWRLVVAGRTGPLLQLALSRPLLQSLGLATAPRPALRAALAECATASLMPALREFFEQHVEVLVEEGAQGWPESDAWVNFQFGLPSLDDCVVPGRLVEPFARKLNRLLAARFDRPRGDVALPLFAGTRMEVPVSAALALREGDVLLGDESSVDPAREVRLYVMSASARQEGRYLATLGRQDGRVERVSPGGWLDAGFVRRSGTPRVGIDIVEARLRVSSERCRNLALGEVLGEWADVAWLDTPEVRLGGRRVARARRISLAGRAGFEILELHRRETSDGVN
jgi:hypothetical protein